MAIVKKVQFVVQITEEMKNFIEQMSDELDISQAEFGRQLLALGREAWESGYPTR